MCGLAGILGYNSCESITLTEMADAISHRGPDDGGLWLDTNQCIGISHRRLSVLDLSSAGHQPMMSANGRYVVVFNGEIYNHLSLRKLLRNNSWRGHSDTETLLAGFEMWGIQATVEKTIGMFAFAVWDRQNQLLTLVRDRIGEKPLYYGWQGNGKNAAFLFGSELKALKRHPSFEGKISRDSLCLLLRHNYIPAPYSIYQGISKLQPGCMLSVSLKEPEPKIWAYWSVTNVVSKKSSSVFHEKPNQLLNELEVLLKDAVKQQMISDVPLGAFLSGGVDSSTIVALMQAQSSRPIKTFTIGFIEERYDEAKHAKTIANFLGTDHTELYVLPEEAMSVIYRLPEMYDEPFADSSQIPTFLVSQLAKNNVTVSLSGDAGDELFCGYHRYRLTTQVWKKLSIFPVKVRRVLAELLTSISPDSWNKLINPGRRLLTNSLKYGNIGDKIHKGAMLLDVNSIDDLYLRYLSYWNDPASVVIGTVEAPTLLSKNINSFNQLRSIQRMMALDLVNYLPDDILVKIDRAAMGVSLETRVPFLDHRVVEFAWGLPQSMKLFKGQSKWALRQILYRYVPKELSERPKKGFAIPLQQWLRGPLREWGEDLLDESRLRLEGYFNASPIRQKWIEHLSGERNWSNHLWGILTFQAWLESVKGKQ